MLRRIIGVTLRNENVEDHPCDTKDVTLRNR